MIVGRHIPVIGNHIEREGTTALRETAKSWNSFSQYTDVESLLCILKNKELKANSILNVDDQKECRYLQPLIDKDDALPYVSCFDHDERENIPLWKMYSGNKYGVRIQFRTPENSSNLDRILVDRTRFVKGYRSTLAPVNFLQEMSEDQSMPYPKAWVRISTKPIFYKNNIDYTGYQLPAKNLINWETLGAIKSEEWGFQNEVRIVANFSHTDYTVEKDEVEQIKIPTFEYLLIPIRFSMLKEIKITFSPWMGLETKRMLRETVDRLNLECSYDLVDSEFDRTIK